MREVMPDMPSDHSISRHDTHHSQYELLYIVWAICRIWQKPSFTAFKKPSSARNIPNFRCIAVGSAAHRKTSKDTEKKTARKKLLYSVRDNEIAEKFVKNRVLGVRQE